MIRAFATLYLAAAAACAQSISPSPDIPVKIQMPNAQMSDFVQLYQALTKRKVWLDAELRFDRKISIVTAREVPRAEAISLIRNALRKDGIEIREIGDSKAYVSRAAP